MNACRFYVCDTVLYDFFVVEIYELDDDVRNRTYVGT